MKYSIVLKKKTLYCFKYRNTWKHTYKASSIPETIKPKGKNLFGKLFAYLHIKTIESVLCSYNVVTYLL